MITETYRSQLQRRIAVDLNDLAAHHQLAAINIRLGLTAEGGDDYDWKEVFNYANGYTREDVAYIVARYDGYNDGDNWEMVGALKDGRWFYLTAGCDYTGWG